MRHSEIRTVDFHTLGVAHEASDKARWKTEYLPLKYWTIEGNVPVHDREYSGSAISLLRIFMRSNARLQPLPGRNALREPQAKLAAVDRKASLARRMPVEALFMRVYGLSLTADTVTGR